MLYAAYHAFRVRLLLQNAECRMHAPHEVLYTLMQQPCIWLHKSAASTRAEAELNQEGACRYAAPLYVDIKKSIITRQPDGEEETVEEMYPKTFLGEVNRPPLLKAHSHWRD
jgi:hypothetical protein